MPKARPADLERLRWVTTFFDPNKMWVPVTLSTTGAFRITYGEIFALVILRWQVDIGDKVTRYTFSEVIGSEKFCECQRDLTTR